MDESLLLKISLATSLIGLVALFLVTYSVRPHDTLLQKINELDEGEDVRVTGVVSKINQREKIAYIDIAYPESRTATVFTTADLKLQKGDFVEITGEVSEFKGEKQLIAQEIDVLN